ncbi:hypothetical protein H1057_19625 [Clostridium sporogenes]|uniref:head decoration protein n=1 Tax=Clostridium sporogenes TaxID=1509 RepID=UPI0015EE5870|nr:head decoration protein [Clostridium sporogenes]MBA4510217.1 hypothetical protein [Clostridium sporogenes]
MVSEIFTPENIFAGNVMPVVTEAALVDVKQTIKKLSIVEKNPTGKIVAPGDTIEAGNAYGIAAEEVTTGEGETKSIVLYMTGEFNASSIVFPDGKTVEDYRTPLRKLGIFLK